MWAGIRPDSTVKHHPRYPTGACGGTYAQWNIPQVRMRIGPGISGLAIWHGSRTAFSLMEDRMVTLWLVWQLIFAGLRTAGLHRTHVLIGPGSAQNWFCIVQGCICTCPERIHVTPLCRRCRNNSFHMQHERAQLALPRSAYSFVLLYAGCNSIFQVKAGWVGAAKLNQAGRRPCLQSGPRRLSDLSSLLYIKALAQDVRQCWIGRAGVRADPMAISMGSAGPHPVPRSGRSGKFVPNVLVSPGSLAAEAGMAGCRAGTPLDPGLDA